MSHYHYHWCRGVFEKAVPDEDGYAKCPYCRRLVHVKKNGMFTKHTSTPSGRHLTTSAKRRKKAGEES